MKLVTDWVQVTPVAQQMEALGLNINNTEDVEEFINLKELQFFDWFNQNYEHYALKYFRRDPENHAWLDWLDDQGQEFENFYHDYYGTSPKTLRTWKIWEMYTHTFKKRFKI